MKKMTQEELLAAFETLADEKHHPSVFRASERIRQHLVAVEAEAARARERALEEAAGLISTWMAVDEHGRCEERMADRIRALKSKPAQEVPRPLFRWSNQKAQRVHLGDEDKRPNDSEPEPGVADYCPEARPKPRREHEWEAGGPSQWRRCKRPGCAWTTQSWSRHDGGPWYCPRDGGKRQKDPGPCKAEPVCAKSPHGSHSLPFDGSSDFCRFCGTDTSAPSGKVGP